MYKLVRACCLPPMRSIVTCPRPTLDVSSVAVSFRDFKIQEFPCFSFFGTYQEYCVFSKFNINIRAKVGETTTVATVFDFVEKAFPHCVAKDMLFWRCGRLWHKSTKGDGKV